MSKKGYEILHKLMNYTDNADTWEVLLLEYTQYLPTEYQKQLIEQTINGDGLFVAFEQEKEDFEPLIKKAREFIED